VPIAQDIATNETNQQMAFWASDAGTLVYRTGSGIGFTKKLLWVNRDGKVAGEAMPEDRYGGLALSPDGKRVAITRMAGEGDTSVWIYEFNRKVMTRLSEGTGND